MRALWAILASAAILTSCLPKAGFMADSGVVEVLNNGSTAVIVQLEKGGSAWLVAAGSSGPMNIVEPGTRFHIFTEYCQLLGTFSVSAGYWGFIVKPDRTVTEIELGDIATVDPITHDKCPAVA